MIKTRLAICCLLIAVTTRAEAVDRLLVLSAVQAKNVYDIPGVKPIDAATAATYGADQMTANSDAINDWLEEQAEAAPTSGRQNVLFVPYGYIAINKTLGADGVVQSGYNGNQPARAIPNGMAIICGGGQAIQDHGCQHSWNLRTAGFVWGGALDQPMIRLARNGNIVKANLYGYPFITGTTEPTDRCRAAIEFWQQPSATQAGHAELDVCVAGCVKAIWCYGTGVTGSHCDHLNVQRLVTRDCLTTFYSDQNQATNHHFDLVEHYCPSGTQSTVFNYQDGGGMTCDHVAVTGDWGATLLITDAASYNVGSYFIRGIKIDRGLLTATQNGNGVFRLHDHESDTPFDVTLEGHMCFGSSPGPSTANWYNQNGSGPSAIRHVAAEATVRRRMRVNVWGLDDVTENLWNNYDLAP